MASIAERLRTMRVPQRRARKGPARGSEEALPRWAKIYLSAFDRFLLAETPLDVQAARSEMVSVLEEFDIPHR